MKRMPAKAILLIVALSFLITNCSSPLIRTEPATVFDTSTVKITCNTEKGNRGLFGFKGPVYAHVGVVTDSSISPTYWRYVKFKWGSTEEAALATAEDDNSWSYTIPNLRKFFEVNENEKILKLAILFRAGNCLDTFCKVQRNADRSDIFIPVSANK